MHQRDLAVILIVGASLTCLPASVAQSQEAPDSHDMARLLLASGDQHWFIRGEIVFVAEGSPDFYPYEGREDETRLPEYTAFAEAEFFTMSDERINRLGDRSATISPLARGRAEVQVVPTSIIVRTGTYTLDEIVATEALFDDTREYRLIIGSATFESSSPEMAELLDRPGVEAPFAQFRWLLALTEDSFYMAAGDRSASSEDFSTNTVDAFITEHGLATSR